MPTYRVMDSDGVIVDKQHEPLDVSDEEALTWYKNMLTVNIMDVIMFEAQRQGRLSFYMVRLACLTASIQTDCIYNKGFRGRRRYCCGISFCINRRRCYILSIPRNGRVCTARNDDKTVHEPVVF